MALKTKVKVGNVSNLSDARYCAGMGVDMIGFCIDTDLPEYVNPELFLGISGWVSGVQFVGETHSDELPDTSNYEFNILQIDDAFLIPQAITKGFEVILTIDLGQLNINEAGELISKYSTKVLSFLIRNDSSKLDTELLAEIGDWSGDKDIILGFGITKYNLNEISNAGIKSIALYGSQQEIPGHSNYDQLADILEELEED